MGPFGLGGDLLWVDDASPVPGLDDALLLASGSLPGGAGGAGEGQLDFLGDVFDLDQGASGGHSQGEQPDMLSYLSAAPGLGARAAELAWAGGEQAWRCLENCHQPCVKCVC